MKQIEPAPDMPSKVVINITDALERFEKTLQKFEELAIETRTAIADVIQCIQDQNDAGYELSHSCYEMLPLDVAIRVADVSTDQGVPVEVAEELVKADENISLKNREALTYAQAHEQLGKDLLALFEAYKLYRHGKLFYQIYKLLDGALVLEKIGVPYLEDATQVRHAENITRQADLAYRRRHIPDVSQLEAILGIVHEPSLFAELRALTAPVDRTRRIN